MLIEEKLTSKTERELNNIIASYEKYYPYAGYGTYFSHISAIGNETGGVLHYEVKVTRSQTAE